MLINETFFNFCPYQQDKQKIRSENLKLLIFVNISIFWKKKHQNEEKIDTSLSNFLLSWTISVLKNDYNVAFISFAAAVDRASVDKAPLMSKFVKDESRRCLKVAKRLKVSDPNLDNLQKQDRPKVRTNSISYQMYVCSLSIIKNWPVFESVWKN